MPPNTVQEHVPCLTPQKCREPSRHFRFPHGCNACPAKARGSAPRIVPGGLRPEAPGLSRPAFRRRQGWARACASPSASCLRPGSAFVLAGHRAERPPYARRENVLRTGLSGPSSPCRPSCTRITAGLNPPPAPPTLRPYAATCRPSQLSVRASGGREPLGIAHFLRARYGGLSWASAFPSMTKNGNGSPGWPGKASPRPLRAGRTSRRPCRPRWPEGRWPSP